MSEEETPAQPPPPRPRRRFLLGILLALPTALVAVALAAVWATRAFDAPGPLAAETIVEIPAGSGLAAIAERLEGAGVVEPHWLFSLGVRLSGKGRALKAGEYLFPAAVSMRDAMALLESGKVVQYALTLPEGLTSREAVALIEQAEALEGRVELAPAEGTLLPETYHYARRDSRQGLLDRMAAAQQAVLAELWPARDPDLPIASPQEAVILASIVEKETGLAEERPLVASVFVNRLRKGMRLQSDPTVVYGITLGERPLGRALTRKDLDQPTPYNSYRIDGLPPTPIANPGRAAIAAVLAPAESDFFYFVASGDGGHAFARTLAEHNRNVAKWRQIQKERRSGGG